MLEKTSRIGEKRRKDGLPASARGVLHTQTPAPARAPRPPRKPLSEEEGKTQERIDAFCLMDDVFMRKCLADYREGVQFIVRAILGDDKLVVKSFSTQKEIANLQGRSAIFDIYAIDGNHREIDIEIQNARKDADVHRARYYSALMDANSLKAGENPRELRDTYVIFITRGDVIGTGAESEHFVRTSKQSGNSLGDGTHIVYVNGETSSNTRIGKLVHDLKCRNSREMYSKVLAKPVRRFKETKKGRQEMSDVVEELRAEGERKARAEERKARAKERKSFLASVKEMINDGVITLDQAIKSFRRNKLLVKELQAMA